MKYQTYFPTEEQFNKMLKLVELLREKNHRIPFVLDELSTYERFVERKEFFTAHSGFWIDQFRDYNKLWKKLRQK